MSIRDKYFTEISNFNGFVQDLKEGRIYELTGVNGNSSASTLADKISESFDEIIDLIDRDKKGTWESVQEMDGQN